MSEQTTIEFEAGDLVRVDINTAYEWDAYRTHVRASEAIGVVVPSDSSGSPGLTRVGFIHPVLREELRWYWVTESLVPVNISEISSDYPMTMREAIDIFAGNTPAPAAPALDSQAELIALRAENAALRDALKPFADAAEDVSVQQAGKDFVLHIRHETEAKFLPIYINGNAREWKFLDASHLFAAATALKGKAK